MGFSLIVPLLMEITNLMQNRMEGHLPIHQGRQQNRHLILKLPFRCHQPILKAWT
jgi:hypothetical protein